MHFGETRHEVLAGTVDPLCVRRQGGIGRGANRRDPSVMHDDGLIGDDALAVHRDDGDADERRDLAFQCWCLGVRRTAAGHRSNEQADDDDSYDAVSTGGCITFSRVAPDDTTSIYSGNSSCALSSPAGWALL